MMGTRLKLWALAALLLALVLGAATPVWAGNPVVCEVTSDKDMDPATGGLISGTLRQMLWFAMAGICQDKVITIRVPKITMNAPLGTGIFSALKGFVITPDASIPQVQITVKYDSADMAAGCSAPSPFDSCFAYLPTTDVTIRNIKVDVDTSSGAFPMKGLCLDQNEDAAGAGPTNNRITLSDNVFDGFKEGGIFVSYDAYGIFITKNLFHDSGLGIVVESDPSGMWATETPTAPIMGGSDQAMYAVVDTQGKVVEYHLRGLSQETVVDSVAPVVELFKSDGKSATDFMMECTTTKTETDIGTGDKKNPMIDEKWNIECVIPNTITLPFTYAASLTRNSGTAPNAITMTSMFSVGTIPVDVKQVPQVTPSQPQTPVTPPATPINDKNPAVYQEKPGVADVNKQPALSITADQMPGGCSLIR